MQEKIYTLYTCNNGITLLKSGQQFAVWANEDETEVLYWENKVLVPESSIAEWDENGDPYVINPEGVLIVEEDYRG
jgi:hypothetical protein